MRNILNYALLAFLLFASSAHASFLSGFLSGGYNPIQPDVTGKFVNPTFQDNTWYDGLGTNVFEFGKHEEACGKYSFLCKEPAVPHSVLKFTGENDIDIESAAPGKFVIGNLKFTNATSIVETSIDAIDLMVGLDFGSFGSGSYTFNLNLDQTINTGNNDDDTVGLPSPFTAPETFLIDGIEYTFMLLFGTLDNGIFTETAFLQAPEEGMDSTQLVGMLTAVPLPAAVWMFGAGLGLFGMVGASRKTA